MHTLTGVFGISPENLEKIPPVRIHPKDRGSRLVHTDIPANKEASKTSDATATEQIKVYSDGSAHGGKVGAAAVLKRPGQPDRTLKVHLGSAKHHTVYEAELAGILMGLHLIKTEKKNKVKSAISVDNQAALRAINSDMTKPGQHLAATIHKIVKHLEPTKGNSRFRLTFRWSAGHVGIKGNEEADTEAKKVAEGESSDPADLPSYLHKPVKHSLSAIRQEHNKKLKRKWVIAWAASPRYRHAPFQDMLTPSSQKYMKSIGSQKISRAAASRIFQLRSGHVPLNHYLHRFKRVDNPRCPTCGHPTETVEHYILQCPKYRHKRWTLLRRAGGAHPKLIKLLANDKIITALVNYMDVMERFKTPTVLPQ